MFRQLHGADPMSPMPGSDDDDGHDKVNAPASHIVPGSGRAAWDPEPETQPSGLPPLPSFSLFSRGQYHNPPTRPRMRRRDAKPSSHKPKSAAQPSVTQSAEQVAVQEPRLGPSFLQVQPAKSQTQESRPRERPFPLQDVDAVETSSPSSPPLPSSSASTHSLTSATEHHRDIEQLADNFSRHGFDLTSRRSGSHSTKYVAPTSGSVNSFGNYQYKMSSLRLRAGGNAPISDLEVDLGGNAPVDDLEVDTAYEQQVHPLCSTSPLSGPGSLASRSLERMRKSQLALSSSRHHPLPQQTSPSTDEPTPPMELETRQPLPPPATPLVAVTAVTAEASLLSSSTHNAMASAEFQPQPCTGQLTSPTRDLPMSAGFAGSLALPQHSPTQKAPSSSYGLKSWLESSSTVDAPPSLVAGTAGANNMTSMYFRTTAEARLSRRKHSGKHQKRPSPLKRVHTPPQSVPSYLDQNGPVDLADGPNPPVADLEVDMIGNEIEVDVDNCDPGAALLPDSPRALEAERRDLSSSDSSTDSVFSSVLAAYLELKKSKSGGNYDSRNVPLSQRIHMAHMEVERELMLRQAGYLPEETAVAEAAVPGTGESMDVEMRDPSALGLPSGSPSVMGGSWVEYPSSQDADTDSQQEGVRRHMGPLRYRLSSEVAMRCTNLVHSRPRMRRRRQGTATKAGTPAVSVGSAGSMSAEDGSSRVNVEGEGIQSLQTMRTSIVGGNSDRHNRHDKHDRHDWHDRWPQISTQERKHRAGRRRELVRQSSRGLLAQAQSHVQARSEAGEQAFSEDVSQQTHTPTGQLQLQLPLPEPIAGTSQVDDELPTA